RTLCVSHFRSQFCEQKALSSRVDHELDFFAVSLRQFVQAVSTFIPIRQRDQIDEQVERGQQPCKDAIRGKVLDKSRKIFSRVSRHVQETASHVRGQHPWNKVARQSERYDPFYGLLAKVDDSIQSLTRRASALWLFPYSHGPERYEGQQSETGEQEC